jgi:excisionase family DNA binding protein
MTPRRGGRRIDLETFTEPMMTVNEAARVLTADRRTVEKWCENGDLVLRVLPGGMRRITTASVRELLRKSEQRAS